MIPGNIGRYEVHLVLSMLALEGCISIPLAWLRMQNRALIFFFAATGRALVQAILVVVLLSAGRDVAGVLEAGLIAALVQALLLGWLHIRAVGFRLGVGTTLRVLGYSLPIVASGLVAFGLNGADRLILAKQASLTDVALFSVAAKFALGTVLLLQPYGMWWTARRFGVLNGPDGKSSVAYYASLGSAMALMIAVTVGLLAPLLINLLLPASYLMAAKYTVALVLIMALKEMTELLNLGCFTGKTTITQFLINSLAAAGGILGMLLFIPLSGVWGIIYALLAAHTLRLVLFFYASQRFLPLPYRTGALVTLTALGTIWLLIGAQSGTGAQQLVTLVVALISLLATAYVLKLLPTPMVFKNQVSAR
jgi:O-antigen/teichoic acid export membrane protein